MCLGIPGQIQHIWEDPETGLFMARVAFGPVLQDICLALVKAQPGEFIIAHAGYAITRLDEAAAQESLQLFSQLEPKP